MRAKFFVSATTARIFAVIVFLISHRAFAQEFTDSNLPIVIISTDVNPDNGQPFPIFDDPRVFATMKIIRRPDGTRNYLTDQNTSSYLNYTGRISIEIRGSSSQDLPKKGYGLTTLQADDETNNNISLLDMPKENDWILNGLAFDPSLLRDYLSYNMSAEMGNYAPRTVYCEVVINGEYAGLYLLQEKIKADSNRVNILKITSSDTSSPAMTGGYITKSDKTTGDDPVAWTMSSYTGSTDFIHDLPKPEEVTFQQDVYIHSQFTNLAALSHNNNMGIASGVPSLIEIPSFVDFMISNELASNVDAYQFSTYFHKDRNGKLRAGPIWDHNLTYGNDLFMYGFDRSHTNVWQFDNNDNEGAKFWKDLFDNPVFKCYFSRRWNELTSPEHPLKHNNLVTFIDNTMSQIREAAARENQKWGTVPDFQGETNAIKTWLYQRINWITSHIGSFSACSNVIVPQLVISKINYNPSANGQYPVANDYEFIEITNTGTSAVNLSGIYFSKLGISYQFPYNSTVNPGQSLFLASNSAAFQSRYEFAAFGQFTRNLSNSSLKLVLADAFGNVIDLVEYLDDAPWPNADGNGSYLQLTDVALDNSLASSWTASDNVTLASAEFQNPGDISVSANPVVDFVEISSSQPLISLRIYDLCGKLLKNIDATNTVMRVDFSTFTQGLYLLKVDYQGGCKTIRIVKQ
jgi:hypothetical protein